MKLPIILSTVSILLGAYLVEYSGVSFTYLLLAGLGPCLMLSALILANKSSEVE